jgi:hypothetical protein
MSNATFQGKKIAFLKVKSLEMFCDCWYNPKDQNGIMKAVRI